MGGYRFTSKTYKPLVDKHCVIPCGWENLTHCPYHKKELYTEIEVKEEYQKCYYCDYGSFSRDCDCNPDPYKLTIKHIRCSICEEELKKKFEEFEEGLIKEQKRKQIEDEKNKIERQKKQEEENKIREEKKIQEKKEFNKKWKTLTPEEKLRNYGKEKLMILCRNKKIKFISTYS